MLSVINTFVDFVKKCMIVTCKQLIYNLTHKTRDENIKGYTKE